MFGNFKMDKEKIKENIEILNLRAQKYGFKNKKRWDSPQSYLNEIKNYLNLRDYFTLLRNISKLKGIEETQKYYKKHIKKIIDKQCREEIAKYKYSSTYPQINKNLLKKITTRMSLFKDELKNKVEDILKII